jgi:histidyl-tRNA synthetase
MKYQKPKGTLDYDNNSALHLKSVISIIEKHFQNNGAEYLETPVFENKEVLMDKYGDEEKLIYEIEDNGGHKLALRYDLTIPFIRWILENKIKKVRRYSIGKVYRRDNPSILQGRFREFYQADFDILGENSVDYSAEILILNMIKNILFDLQIVDFEIHVNFTENLYKILIDDLKIEKENFKNICSTIDKLDKTDFEQLIDEFKMKSLNMEQINQLKVRLFEPYRNDKLDELLEIYDIKKYIKYNQSLARGLDYYNGIIFEVKLKNNQSTIIAGGRYDNLNSINNKLIGVSVGITRLMQFTNFIKEEKWLDEYYLTCIGNIDNKMKHKLIKYISDGVAKNKKITFSLDNDHKIQKVISNIIKQSIKWLIIIGEEELKTNTFIIKDLENKTQEIVEFSENILNNYRYK